MDTPPISAAAASERAVVIAGIGMVTPAGANWAETWARVCAGHSAIGPIRRFDPAGLDVHVAAEVVGALPPPDGESWREGLAIQAVVEAMSSADLDLGCSRGTRLGIFSGCEKDATDNLSLFRRYAETDADEAPIALDHVHDLDRRHADRPLRMMAERFGSADVVLNYSMACAASAVALVQAVRWIRRGRIDRALVIGVDTPINSWTVHGFQLLGALSTSGAEPKTVCRPFDLRRDGFVLGEGAGAFILESPRLSRRRKGPCLGRILGVGLTNNRSHVTNTPRSGEQAARALEMAVADAGVSRDTVGYINAHATSTDVGDIGEANAINAVFSPAPPVSGTKSTTGHLVAAAGIVELGLTVAAVMHQFLPPTINVDQQDPECRVDCVPHIGRRKAICYAISNSFGFGGTNVSILIGGP